MVRNRHSDQTIAEGIHIIHAYEYASAAARVSATGFTAADVGKAAMQQDNFSWWILSSYSPVVWAQVASTGSLSSVALDVQVFSASGVWTKPTGAIMCFVDVVAGGGGGGGGPGQGAGTGGAGGGGGARNRATFPAFMLNTTESVTVGNSGSAGIGGLNGLGSDGGTGGSSSFGSYVSAFGGLGGSAGVIARVGGAGGGTMGTGSVVTNTTIALGGPPGVHSAFITNRTVPQHGVGGGGADAVTGSLPSGQGTYLGSLAGALPAEYGGASGAATQNATFNNGFPGAISLFGGGGGGSGGGSTQPGGDGGSTGPSTGSFWGGGGLAGASGSNGSPGADGNYVKSGQGGGGAGGTLGASGRSGGAGGWPGGGGGGGGIGTNLTGGLGGVGGLGQVQVITWCVN